MTRISDPRRPIPCVRPLAALAALWLLILATPSQSAASAAPSPEAVVATHADIAAAMYEDAHSAAVDLQAAVNRLLDQPTPANLEAARQSWIAARPWYLHSEVFRFSNPVVDDWEGRVNSWPLDEGFIDYVDPAFYGTESDENALFTANIIANRSVRIGDKTIDTSTINADLLRNQLHEAGDADTNVATGYHAIEFLLWGQDLNGTGPGAGNRPATDFDRAACSNGNCDRRGDYLRAATQLLVDDLAEMAAAWKPGGAARADLERRGGTGGLAAIVTALGSLSYGELAGERTKLAVLLHEPEEEQDCFSDNTHNAMVADVDGIRFAYEGRYVRRDGTVVTGPSLRDYAQAKAPAEAARLTAAIDETTAAFARLKAKADNGMRFDQMLASGNDEGNAMILEGVDALVRQTRALEALSIRLGLAIKVEGSDALAETPSAGAN